MVVPPARGDRNQAAPAPTGTGTRSARAPAARSKPAPTPTGSSRQAAGSRQTAASPPAPTSPPIPEPSPGLPESRTNAASGAAQPSVSKLGGEGSPASSAAQPRASKPTLAPRGSAPAVALKRARELFAARQFADAAHSWNEWARQVPSGSWTIQVAALRPDHAAAGASLGSGAGRGEMFMLPAGSLPGGLLPVCVGVYPSEEAARRAIAAMPRIPGSSSPPIAKRIESLRSND